MSEQIPLPHVGVTRVIDVRAQQSALAPRTRDDGNGRTLQRDPHTVDGVVLHQTGVVFGIPAKRVARAGGDRGLAQALRALRVPTHVTAFRSGVIAIAHEPTAYCYHAGRLNASTLGLEIEGVYPGLRDDPETPRREDIDTLWGDIASRTELDPLTITTAQRALVKLVELGRACGMPLQYVYAHRQSSAHRRPDPGEELWKALLPTAERLGLKPRPNWTVNGGRPIPAAWGGHSNVPY